MGAFLDKPKTDKLNTRGEGAGVRYGIAAMQGWRVDMEDAHCVRTGVGTGALAGWSYAAVFDGHAGDWVARHCADHLLDAILQATETQNVVQQVQKENKDGCLTATQARSLQKGIAAGFILLDEKMRQDVEQGTGAERSGSTVVCVLITPHRYFIANLGDSRALLAKRQAPLPSAATAGGKNHGAEASKKGGTAVEKSAEGASDTPFATLDHKPYLPTERDRIVQAGGSVMIQRVNGSLAVSRALGDYEYKSVPGLPANQQLVSPEPDVFMLERCQSLDEFIILACDGIFDVMSNSELIDYVRYMFQVTEDICAVCNDVLDTCLSKGSRDNMSVVIVALPAAPKANDSAKEKHEALRKNIHARVKDIFDQTSDPSSFDVEHVIYQLTSQDIPNLPAGAGVHGCRSMIASMVESMKPASAKSTSTQNSSKTESRTEVQKSPAS